MLLSDFLFDHSGAGADLAGPCRQKPDFPIVRSDVDVKDLLVAVEFEKAGPVGIGAKRRAMRDELP